MKIIVTFNTDDDEDVADPDHATGLTDDAYGALIDALMSWGAYDIDVRQAP